MLNISVTAHEDDDDDFEENKDGDQIRSKSQIVFPSESCEMGLEWTGRNNGLKNKTKSTDGISFQSSMLTFTVVYLLT